jgi:acetyl-CoA carboxylase biotin carboxyl carrier protein
MAPPQKEPLSMDLRKLKTLIDLVSESNISELEITEAEGKVRIVKAGAPAAPAAPTMMMMAPSGQAMAAPAPAATVPTAAPAAEPAPTGHVVKSPMVGTFYRSGTPGAKPLVDVGLAVKPGDPLCIIEAMKIMNEIECDQAGTVTQILVQDGQAVEYGQPLFLIE